MSGQRRILKEFADIQALQGNRFSLTLPTESDIYTWSAILNGPAATPYSNGKFTVTIRLSTDYPFKAPTVNFDTRIYHPNITDDDKGAVCLGILKAEAWKPNKRVVNILEALEELLATPNPEDPLEASIAEQYTQDRAAFNEVAKKATAKYAIGK